MTSATIQPVRSGGFTLVEIVIVIVIIGILAAIAIPKFYMFGEDAKASEAKTVLKHVYTLQNRHSIATGQYADLFSELEGSAEPVSSATYYHFRLQRTPAGFTACATPKAGHVNARSFAIDQDVTVTTLGSAAECTGNPP